MKPCLLKYSVLTTTLLLFGLTACTSKKSASSGPPASPLPQGGPGVLHASLSIAAGAVFSFGKTILGAESTLTFTLINEGKGSATGLPGISATTVPFSFSGGTFPGTGGTCQSSLAPGASCTVVIAFDPLSLGTVSGSIKLSYSDIPGVHWLSIPVDGEGVNPGNPDPLWNSGAAVKTSFGASYNEAHGVVVQPDGKIVAAGFTYNGSDYDFALARYAPNGNLDTSFGGLGKVSTAIGSGNDYAYSLALQADGKVIAGGNSFDGTHDRFTVVRYLSDGTKDNTFGTSGVTSLSVGASHSYGYSLAVQSDGKAVLAGSAVLNGQNHFAVARFLTDGTLDLGFGSSGTAIIDMAGTTDICRALALQPDGKLVLAGYVQTASGYQFAVTRLLSNGNLDTGFATNGRAIVAIGSVNDYAYAIALQADGKIVVAGRSNNGVYDDFAVARLLSSGQLDPTFSGLGKLTSAIGNQNQQAQSVLVQPDGKIVAAGFAYGDTTGYDFALVRYLSDGSVDPFFAGFGVTTTAVSSFVDRVFAAALQPDGKIVAVGDTYSSLGFNSFALLRYLP